MLPYILPICLLKDVREHVPSPIPGINSDKMNSEWAAGLIGYALNANVNMKIIHWGINAESELDSCKIILHQDNGVTSKDLANRLAELIRSGHVVVNLLADSLAAQMGVNVASQNISGSWQRQIAFLGIKASQDSAEASQASFKALASPFFEYALPTSTAPAKGDQSNCFPVFRSGVVYRQLKIGQPESDDNGQAGSDNVSGRSVNGYGCLMGQGAFYQLGTLFYDVFNSDGYVRAKDIHERTLFLRELLKVHNISPHIAVAVGDPQARVVAFGRQVPDRPEFWVTVKSGGNSRQGFKVTVREADPEKSYSVRDLLSNHEETLTGQVLRTKGFDAELDNLGSTVYWITPAPPADGAKPPA